MKNLVFKEKIDDEEVELELTPAEVEAGLSVCHINGQKNVFCLKGAKGGALFFTEERHALATQDQDKFDCLWTLEKSSLEKHAKSEKIRLKFLEDPEKPKEQPKKPDPPKNTGNKPPILNA